MKRFLAGLLFALTVTRAEAGDGGPNMLPTYCGRVSIQKYPLGTLSQSVREQAVHDCANNGGVFRYDGPRMAVAIGTDVHSRCRRQSYGKYEPYSLSGGLRRSGIEDCVVEFLAAH
jgi:hypothetical protein